ncbi:hypothetical protein NKI44_29795 [Mesorhizobium sp. M0614]|uniref:hypothetical protein n=1 Tax=Mesorhizobium sp. M0614 TaxID=2956970 RepID=UPI00333DD324
MDLVSPEDYASLPVELGQKFVAFEEICRRNLNSFITSETTPNFDQLIRLQYMSMVAAAAAECGVDGLEFPWNLDEPYDGFQSFLLKAAGVATRFRLRGAGKPDEYSVRLANKTRGRIEQQITKLRDIIVNSDLPEGQRKGLLDKLNELSVELSQPRVGFGKVMAILAIVSATLVGTTSFLSDAPNAIATITSLLGADRVAEEAETERLGPPPQPKSLPPKPRALPAPDFGLPPERKHRELDDEIPF